MNRQVKDGIKDCLILLAAIVAMIGLSIAIIYIVPTICYIFGVGLD